VHRSGYDTTALDIEVDPQRCRFGSRKSDFALQALVECRALVVISRAFLYFLLHKHFIKKKSPVK
jgi:hypothetical protein